MKTTWSALAVTLMLTAGFLTLLETVTRTAQYVPAGEVTIEELGAAGEGTGERSEKAVATYARAELPAERSAGTM